MNRIVGDLLVIVPTFLAGTLLIAQPFAASLIILAALIATSIPRRPSIYRHRPMPREHRRDRR